MSMIDIIQVAPTCRQPTINNNQSKVNSHQPNITRPDITL